jgi:hypothetical protein
MITLRIHKQPMANIMKSPLKFGLRLAVLAACFAVAAPSAMAMGQASGTNQGNGGALYSGLGPAGTRPAEFLADFVQLTQTDLAANAALLSSLGLAGEAGRSTAEADAFSVETTPSKIEATVGSAGAAHQLVMTKLASGPVLTAENQATFAAGALGLAQAVKRYAEVAGNLVAVKKALVDAGQKGRIALFAAKTVPATLAQVRQQLQAMVQFAKANNIPLAAEVYEAAAAA